MTRLLCTTVFLGALFFYSVAQAEPQPRETSRGLGLDVAVGLMHVSPQIDSPVIGADASTETNPVVGLTYHLNESIALNTALGITRHEFSAPGLGNLGKVSLAPFHAVVQYRFLPGSAFRPYVGVGVNRTVFFRQGGPVFSLLEDFKSSTGPVLQAGFDYALGKQYFLNLDFKKFYIDTDVVFKGGSKVETIGLDPTVISAAIGYRF